MYNEQWLRGKEAGDRRQEKGDRKQEIWSIGNHRYSRSFLNEIIE